MSDSRGKQPEATGAEKRAEVRSRRTAQGKTESAGGTDDLAAENKIHVRIDPAHAIGDAPPESEATIAESAATEAAPPISEPANSDQAASDIGQNRPDAPAETADSQAASPLGPIAADEQFAVEKLQQLQLQLEQLSSHLRAQQYQLDRREAQLNSHLAKQENEIRTTRLWFRERQQELVDREADLQIRQQESESAQATRLAAREAAISQREENLESNRAALVENISQREAELARRETDFDLKSAEWAKDRAEWIQAQAAAEAECRAAKLQWQEHADALADDRRALERSREALEEQSESQRLAVISAREKVRTEPPPRREPRRDPPVDSSPVREQRSPDAEPLSAELASMVELMRQFLGGEDQASESAAPTVGISDARATFAEFRSVIVKLQYRQRNLDEAEALLADGQVALDLARQQLTADRQAWHELSDEERRRFADERRHSDAEIEKKLRAFNERNEHLERRTAAVDQLRAEVLRAQRETLELRLATDEIWAQLAGSVPPPMLTQSLARIRNRLAEQYRLERSELIERQQQLEALNARIDAQHDKFQQQKATFEQWVADRRGEIEGQASRLVAQEMEIARRQSELEELAEQQKSERRVYEAEIRRLLGELRKSWRQAAA